MAVAAATREAAKRKREAENGLPGAKRPARPIPLISHEVAVPKGYDEAAKNLDPALHGTLLAVQMPFTKMPSWSSTIVAPESTLIGQFCGNVARAVVNSHCMRAACESH